MNNATFSATYLLAGLILTVLGYNAVIVFVASLMFAVGAVFEHRNFVRFRKRMELQAEEMNRMLERHESTKSKDK